jgi:16S rRNA (cytosine967-C5)-methyltransferase
MGKESALERTSALDNVDPWLLREFTKAYGTDKATMIVEAAMSENPTFITVNQMAVPAHDEVGKQQRLEAIRDVFATVFNPPKSDDEAVDTNTESSSDVILPTGSILVDNCRGPVSKWPLYDDGDWWVQNPSSTVPAIALWKGLRSRSKRCDDDGGTSDDEGMLSSLHVVDMCSAPGGKTAQLCAFGFGQVDAIEINDRRTKILRQNLKRLGMEDMCNVVVADGTQWKPVATGIAAVDGRPSPPLAETYVDGIIVDAPCSATGNGSRQPEVLRKSINLQEQVTIQRQLLAHAVDDILRPGGIMVYATCSLLQQEGEEQMRWLLSTARAEDRSSGIGHEGKCATMEIIPFVSGEIPGFDEAIDENGWLRILPGTLPGPLRFCDGFFVARLRKV